MRLADGKPGSIELTPPKRTMFWAVTIAHAARGSGPVSAACVHALPSHSHVSLSPAPFAPAPPNRTTREAVKSVQKAIAWARRADGPTSWTWVHSVPSHSQVSPSGLVAV